MLALLDLWWFQLTHLTLRLTVTFIISTVRLKSFVTRCLDISNRSPLDIRWYLCTIMAAAVCMGTGRKASSTLVVLRESPSSLRPSEDQSICMRMTSYKRLSRSPPCLCCSRSALCIWHCCAFSQTSRQSHVMSAWGNFPCKRLGLAVSLFCWARARAFNFNKSSVGRAVAFGRATLDICRCTVLPKHVQGPVVQVKVRVEVVWVHPVMTGVAPRHQDMTILHVVPDVYSPPHTRGLPRMLIFGVDCLCCRLLRVQHQIQGGEDP